MKNILWILLLAAGVGRAQTYVNYKLTSFAWNGSSYVASTNIIVPTNTLLTVRSMGASPNISSAVLTLQYPGAAAIVDSDPTTWLNYPVLGPVTGTITASSSSSSGNFANMLVEFDTANTTPLLQGYAVQPNGRSATILLESSTNLATWTTATNGTYAATNRAMFYRLNFSVQ